MMMQQPQRDVQVERATIELQIKNLQMQIDSNFSLPKTKVTDMKREIVKLQALKNQLR